jgi:prepilin-type N-terminal cleavage/methylation domain-containing protein
LKQIASAAPQADRHQGFTLVEALAALAISAAIMLLLSEMAGQALRNWNRNATTIASTDMLTTGVGRLALDLAHTLPIPDPKSRPEQLLFRGTSKALVLSVVSGLGPGEHGMELVAVTVVTGPRESVLVRRRTRFDGAMSELGDPVILLRGAFDMHFTYHGHAGERVADWSGRQTLPRAVELVFSGRDDSPPSVVLPMAASFPADCIGASAAGTKDKGRCGLRSPAQSSAGR